MTCMKKQRLVLEKSQSQMAKELGVSVGTYIRKERDPDAMTLKEIKRFVAATGCNPMVFFIKHDSTNVECEGGV